MLTLASRALIDKAIAAKQQQLVLAIELASTGQNVGNVPPIRDIARDLAVLTSLKANDDPAPAAPKRQDDKPMGKIVG